MGFMSNATVFTYNNQGVLAPLFRLFLFLDFLLFLSPSSYTPRCPLPLPLSPSSPPPPFPLPQASTLPSLLTSGACNPVVPSTRFCGQYDGDCRASDAGLHSTITSMQFFGGTAAGQFIRVYRTYNATDAKCAGGFLSMYTITGTYANLGVSTCGGTCMVPSAHFAPRHCPLLRCSLHACCALTNRARCWRFSPRRPPLCQTSRTRLIT
jgi:hypothetical protein